MLIWLIRACVEEKRDCAECDLKKLLKADKKKKPRKSRSARWAQKSAPQGARERNY